MTVALTLRAVPLSVQLADGAGQLVALRAARPTRETCTGRVVVQIASWTALGLASPLFQFGDGVSRPALINWSCGMFETWNPTGNPVHFLIELGDVLAGGYLRFTSSTQANLAAARVEFDTVQDGVMVWANYGRERDTLINRSIACLIAEYRSRGETPDVPAITNLIEVGFINSFQALCQYRPAVRMSDLAVCTPDPTARSYRGDVFNAQSNGFGMLARARAELLSRLARLGITVPAHIETRSQHPGPLARVTFRDLPAAIPVFQPDANQPSPASPPTETVGGMTSACGGQLHHNADCTLIKLGRRTIHLSPTRGEVFNLLMIEWRDREPGGARGLLNSEFRTAMPDSFGSANSIRELFESSDGSMADGYELIISEPDQRNRKYHRYRLSLTHPHDGTH